MTSIIPSRLRKPLQFIERPMAWTERASCKNVPMTKGVSIFFPQGKNPDWRIPRAMCANCQVLQECHDTFNQPPIPAIGMYFGLTPVERRRHYKNTSRSKGPKKPWKIPKWKLYETPRR